MRVLPGHMKPGVRVGSTAEYNPNTKPANLIKRLAFFATDANLGAIKDYIQINMATNGDTAGQGYL